jgi:hypothetical protein
MNRFPKEAPAWQAMDADYNKRIDEADAPLFVQPTELGSAELVDGEVLSPINMPMQEPSINPMQQISEQDRGSFDTTQASNAMDNWVNSQGDMESSDSQPAMPSQAPMSPSLTPQEKMMAEYKAMQDQDRKDLQDARSSDRNLKMGGAIGDALATYLNARGQMNVKAPGVQVQQGAGLGKIADMFATAPDVASDLKSKREDLLAQYKQLQTGKDRELQERRVKAYEKQVDASGKAKEGLSPYQELMLGEKAKAREQKNVNSMKEVETRRSIIEENVKRAKDLINQYGTIELTGSQEDQLNGIMNEIATDTAKLQDPDSVARPSEVESVRSTLLPENRSDRLFISNDTAIDTLNKFKDRIDERAKIGYDVRGLTPAQRTQKENIDTQTKVVNGITYKKVTGGWEEVN